MTPLGKLCRLHDAITDASYLVSALGLTLMVLIYCAEVVTRYFLNFPLDWANDAFSNILCVMIFSMLPHATRAAAHIEINLLPELVPALRKPLSIWTAITGTVVCGLAAWMSLHENFLQLARGILTPQNHPVPVIWMTGFITYGFTSSALYFFRSLFPKNIRSISWFAKSAEEPTAGSV